MQDSLKRLLTVAGTVEIEKRAVYVPYIRSRFILISHMIGRSQSRRGIYNPALRIVTLTHK